jgi:hypothetical protein
MTNAVGRRSPNSADPSGKPKLTAAQVQQIQTGTAIALAESGGDEAAVNYNMRLKTGKVVYGNQLPAGATLLSTDRGVWQINDKAHPDVTSAQAFSLDSATDAAYTISSGFTSWGAWATYTSGAYKAHLSDAAAGWKQADVGLAGPTGLEQAAMNLDQVTTGGWSSITGLIAALMKVSTWIRIGEVIGGAALALLGLALLSRGLIEAAAIGPVAGAVRKIGGAAQAIKGAAA